MATNPPCTSSSGAIATASSAWSTCGSAASLAGRVDDSDVLQEAFLDVSRHLDDYLKQAPGPFFLWLRHMTGLKLAEIHRRHLGTQLRNADREVTLHRGGMPMADSVSLAAQLLGTLTTPSQAAIKAETRLLVQEALNSMDPIDREVLALKHFEQLSMSEIAVVLGLSKAGTGSRYPSRHQETAGDPLSDPRSRRILSGAYPWICLKPGGEPRVFPCKPAHHETSSSN